MQCLPAIIPRCIKGYGDCEQKSVTRKIRDFAVSAIALLALFGMLLSINPDLRERVTRLASDRQFVVVQSAVSHVATVAVEATRSFAGNNTYLFGFLVAACVFFVLMVKGVL
jgi:hypothetical protein